MIVRMATDIVVLIHLAFIIFVAAGGVMVLRWPRLAWFHLPAVFWGALVELAGWTCPLTPLENSLRTATGGAAYSGGFIDRYIMPIVYPEGLTRTAQVSLGVAVLTINLIIYVIFVLRRRKHHSRAG